MIKSRIHLVIIIISKACNTKTSWLKTEKGNQWWKCESDLKETKELVCLISYGTTFQSHGPDLDLEPSGFSYI